MLKEAFSIESLGRKIYRYITVYFCDKSLFMLKNSLQKIVPQPSDRNFDEIVTFWGFFSQVSHAFCELCKKNFTEHKSNIFAFEFLN